MMAWLPIFFMYFNEHLKLEEVLILEAIYYISVVGLEIPSGYFSDVIGRRITLIISSMGFALAYLLFGFFSPGFLVFIIAQILLAVGMAFMSGTNTSFYYESLQSVNKESEFAQRIAKIESWKQSSSAIVVLIGGWLGVYALNLPYLLSFALVLPALILCFLFKEPDVHDHSNEFRNPINQLREVWKFAKSQRLFWIFLYSVFVYLLAHIPYEFYQPYLKQLEVNGLTFALNASLLSGIIFAATRFIGAFASYKSATWAESIGLIKLCFIAFIIQLIIIAGMASVLHNVIIVLVLARSFSMSMTLAPINSVIANTVTKSLRATYFSFQSLISRLSFSLVLLFLSVVTKEGNSSEWAALSKILWISTVIGLICLIILTLVKKPKFLTTNN